jgi:hypothetical protein
MNSKIAEQSVVIADMIDRLALAACGSVLWPNPYARDYHRAAVRRMLAAMTNTDIDAIKRLRRA